MFVLLVVSGAMAAVPTCRKFEAYLQCGPPVEEFRAPEMDLKCDEFVVGAGYCVCAEEECKDEANWIRVEIDCGGDPMSRSPEPLVYFVAEDDIGAGAELLFDYGEEYWRGHESKVFDP